MSEATEELTPTRTTTMASDGDGALGSPSANGNGEASGLPATQRDIQRMALRDLVSLATESAATETEIEQKFQASSEEADKELQQTLWAAEQRANTNADAAKKKAAERTASLDAKYAADAAALKKRDEQARQKVAGDHDPATQQLKQRYDQAVWLADSVHESTQSGIHDELKKKKEEINNDLKALADDETQANTLLGNYGVTPPVVEHQAQVTPEQADAVFAAQRDAAHAAVQRLGGMMSARLAVGSVPIVIAILLAGLGAAAGQFFMAHGFDKIDPKDLGIGGGAGLVLGILIVLVLKTATKSGSTKLYKQFAVALLTTRAAAEQRILTATKIQDEKLAEAQKARDAEVRKAKDKVSPQMAKVKASRDAALQAQAVEYRKQVSTLQQQRDANKKEVADWLTKTLADIKAKHEREQEKARALHAEKTSSGRSGYDAARSSLERRLREGLANTQAPIEDTSGVLGQGAPDWEKIDWKTWKPSKQFASVVRFGELGVDLKKIADSVPRKGELKLQLPPPYTVPALLAFPKQASLLVESDREGRQKAIEIIQMAMVRLLTSLPPGRVRFTMIDPVGLGQNFAGFMHLADFDEATVSGRIFTDTEAINQRLIDLTDHMQTVIQKYLRNEFETIDDYNAQAGELAEPYRFLVIADFPVGFESEALRRLSSIATSGARCGVYTIIARDTRQDLPGGTFLDDLYAHSTVIRQEGDRFVWHDEVYGQFPLTPDPDPNEETLTQILQAVGSKAKEAKRVEVGFHTIAPNVPDFWTLRSDDELRVPIGKMGATRLQSMRLGKGVAQHVIIAGKTGSGKSTLLHALIANLAMWYSPDEVEMYLIDFKKGVEFKTYATHQLPHARAIAVESDREFGLSVLQRLDGELTRRGDMFRKVGAQNIFDYRKAVPDAVMPRVLLIIDEFQEFFTEDDKIGQDAALLIDRLVRQGRAFGVHVLLGSQTIGGSGGLNRATLGQMAVRIALMTSEADSQLILGDGNSAARLLSRPGEAIYNDQNGAVEGNSPFQVAYLSDDGRDVYLDRVNSKMPAYLAKHQKKFEPPLVFEGNAPADIQTNVTLAKLIADPAWPQTTQAPVGWMGDPVAIKEASGAVFRRQSGANVLIIGQSEENSIAITAAMLVSLAAQHKPGSAKFVIFDGNPADSPYANVLPNLKGMLPHDVELVEWKAVEDKFGELGEELKRRQGGEEGPSIFVFVYGLQRYRMLRKSEDSGFSFSSMSADEGEKKAAPDKVFSDLIREGPNVGMHIISWIDTPAAIERTFERGMLREFDTRVLFQMSATDSSNLIDSPAANKLGFYRALQYSEEQGSMEKFRPYAMPDLAWLENMKAKFAAKK